MSNLIYELDQAILCLSQKRRHRTSMESMLIALSYQVVEYIQHVGKRKIAESINEKFVVLKHLIWDYQKALVNGADLYYFFSNVCDIYEGRFSYSSYISEYFLHVVEASSSFEEDLDRRYRDIGFIIARLVKVERQRSPIKPLRLRSCLNVLALLKQDYSPAIKDLIAEHKDTDALLEASEPMLTAILEKFQDSPRYYPLYCSVLPTSPERSEFLFISVVQIVELSFNLMGEALKWISGSLEDGMVPEEALTLGQRLCDVADFSVACTSILNDFTHDEFLLFREQTGGAGAIQSSKYKLIEIYTNKFIKDRIQQGGFDTVPYLKFLSDFKELHLYDKFEELPPSEALETLKAKLNRFEKTLMDWKRFHLHIAKSRLLNHIGPPGTEIAHYLSTGMVSTFSAPKPVLV